MATVSKCARVFAQRAEDVEQVQKLLGEAGYHVTSVVVPDVIGIEVRINGKFFTALDELRGFLNREQEQAL